MKRTGEPAALYFDSPRHVVEGDYLRTPTGRTYLVQAVRIQQRGKHAGRQHLSTVVVDPAAELGDDATVHPLHWYRRRRSKGTR